jgi:hypothetical protein
VVDRPEEPLVSAQLGTVADELNRKVSPEDQRSDRLFAEANAASQVGDVVNDPDVRCSPGKWCTASKAIGIWANERALEPSHERRHRPVPRREVPQPRDQAHRCQERTSRSVPGQRRTGPARCTAVAPPIRRWQRQPPFKFRSRMVSRRLTMPARPSAGGLRRKTHPVNRSHAVAIAAGAGR